MWLVREREKAEKLKKEREEELRKQNKNVEEENTETQYEFQPSFWSSLRYNTILRWFLIILFVAVLAPIIVIIIINLDNIDDSDNGYTCMIRPEFQIPCGPQNTTERKCSDIKCCFNSTTKGCYQYAPSKYQYRVISNNKQETFNLVPILKNSPFGKQNLPEVTLSLRTLSKDTLKVVLHENSYMVENSTTISDVNYNVTIYTEEMGLEVFRTGNNSDMIFSTNYGPTIVSDKYWEWTVDLKTSHLFGMDFLHLNFNETVTRIVYKNANDHNSIPAFWAYQNGKFHGLTVEHSGPLEVIILPSGLIVFRLLSGNFLTFYLTTGPKPEDVYKQQRKGLEEVMPPYWALGVHICRNGQFSSVKDILQEFNDFNKNAKFPYDSDCIHENLFSLSMDVTTEIKEALKQIVDKSKYFVMSLSPQILVDTPAYQKAKELKILYTDTNTKPILGKYLKQSVAFPDYGLTDARKWFKDFYSKLGIDANAFVLKDNWPVSDDYKMNPDGNFQYMTQNISSAMSRTLPWNSISPATKRQHIDLHNEYGELHAATIAELNPGKFILSAVRDTAAGGAHAENVDELWANYKQTLTRTLSLSLFGGPMYSVPVCGTNGGFGWDSNRETLCVRWYQTAATLPVFRISSDKPRRDVLSFQDKFTQNFLLEAIHTRYTLLPYLYSTLTDQLPLLRPMFFNFPDDNTLRLDEQYMVGDALLVAQPVLLDFPVVRLYLPKNKGGWYEFWGGLQYSDFGNLTIPILDTDLLMFIAAGKIVPLYYKLSLINSNILSSISSSTHFDYNDHL